MRGQDREECLFPSQGKNLDTQDSATGHCSKEGSAKKTKGPLSAPVKKETSAFAAVSADKKKENDNKKPIPERGKRIPKCAICQQAHWNDECRTLDTVEKRKAQVREQKLCFKCLREGHSVKKCRIQKMTCCHCKGDHNRALCTK